MAQKPKVLIASYLEQEFVEQIQREVPEVDVLYYPEFLGQPRYIADHTASPNRSSEQETQWQELLAQADILFDFDFSHQADLPKLAPNLKWIQATSAGIGQYVNRLGYFESTNWTFTTASGVHARPLAEFAIMAMLMFAKDYGYLEREKQQQHWQRYCARELSQYTLGIIGLGKIGQEVARLARAFQMRIVGSRRHPENEMLPFIDTMYGSNEHDLVLQQADFLVLSTPHTSETERLIGRNELALLPEGCVLINIARGKIVEQTALIEALYSGRLRGAALDVFDIEPLPQDDPLWKMPNVIISPHSASTAETENAKLTTLFCDNLKRFLREEPLRNVLDRQKLY